MKIGTESLVNQFLSPQELWNKTYPQGTATEQAAQWRDKFSSIPFENKSGTWQPRYYQEIAVRNTLEAIAQGKDRILLTLATGTRKTAIAFQIAWKLFYTRWNLSATNSSTEYKKRRPRILFLVDKNIFFKVLLLLTIVTTKAQTHSQIVSKYSNYFNLPREIFYIQTNKTNFKQGEAVYFSVYVLNNKTRKPFLETTNVYCGLYDSSGNQISRGIFYTENGIATGKFSLDSLKSPGVFYINATSNWNKNFKGDNSFKKELYLEKKIFQKNRKHFEPSFFIKFMGEGGSLLSDTVNSIGFKIEDQFGKGYALESGKILNDKNKVVHSNITSNKFGIGKFNLNLINDSKYVALFKLKNGTEIQQKLPELKIKGVNLMINSLSKDFVSINIQTNSKTWPLIKGKTYKLAIYRDNHIFLKEFNFNKISKIFQVLKKDLLKGLNFITLFDNNGNPILERTFYNNASRILVNFNIKSVNTDKDSTHIIINLPSSLVNSAHVSIAVLPTKSNAYNFSKSITSEYLLAAYLNTNIEHLSHYFKNDSLKYLYQLDNLLLVEGKHKFEWRDVFNDASKIKYEFNKGFNITGKLFNKGLSPKSKILFYQKSISNAFFTEIKPDNTFNIKNIYLAKEDSLSFTINDEKGHNILPILNVEINPKIGKIHLFNLPKNNYKVVQHHNIVKPDLQQNITRLDEVTIIGKIGKRKINFDHQMPSTGVFKAKKISTKDIKKHPKLSNYIKKLGFKIVRYPTGEFMIWSNRTWTHPPVIFIDGFKTLNLIYDYQLKEINAISYEKFGLTGSDGGTIYINLKYGAEKVLLLKKTKQILADNGFEKTIIKYSPKILPNNRKFQPDYIYWNGNLKTNKQGEIKIDFPNFGIKEYKIYIEGFTENGDLISQEFNLNSK